MEDVGDGGGHEIMGTLNRLTKKKGRKKKANKKHKHTHPQASKSSASN